MHLALHHGVSTMVRGSCVVVVKAMGSSVRVMDSVQAKKAHLHALGKGIQN